MSASPETAAAMTTPAPPHHPAEPPAATSPAAGSADTSSSAAGSPDTGGSAAGTDMSGAAGGRAAQRRELSTGAAIALFGGLMTTMVGVLAGLMMWQFDSLDNRIETLGTDLRGEIATLETELRGEMQAGFREVNATLLDHTDRLARLEASVDAGA